MANEVVYEIDRYIGKCECCKCVDEVVTFYKKGGWRTLNIPIKITVCKACIGKIFGSFVMG